MKVSEQIRMHRERLDMTLSELGRRLDVSPAAIRHWETGRSMPGRKMFAAIEEVFGTKIDWTGGQGVEESDAVNDAMLHLDDYTRVTLRSLLSMDLDSRRAFAVLAQAHADLITRSELAHSEPRPTRQKQLP